MLVLIHRFVLADCPTESDAEWGGQCIPAGDYSVSSCRFQNCEAAPGTSGGAILIQLDNPYRLIVSECCFGECSTYFDGGAICCRNPVDMQSLIQRSAIQQCTGYYGGFLYGGIIQLEQISASNCFVHHFATLYLCGPSQGRALNFTDCAGQTATMPSGIVSFSSGDKTQARNSLSAVLLKGMGRGPVLYSDSLGISLWFEDSFFLENSAALAARADYRMDFLRCGFRAQAPPTALGTLFAQDSIFDDPVAFMAVMSLTNCSAGAVSEPIMIVSLVASCSLVIPSTALPTLLSPLPATFTSSVDGAGRKKLGLLEMGLIIGAVGLGVVVAVVVIVVIVKRRQGNGMTTTLLGDSGEPDV